MKKLIYCAAALAAMIFAGSCQQENLEPVAQENTVTYTVELPGLATKAGATDYKFGSGLNTDELIYEVWKTENGNETNLTGTNAVRLYQETVDLYVIDGVRKTTISLNLVQDQEYTILFWAQVKGADVYNTENLTKVQYKHTPSEGDYVANREDMAAFYAVDFVSDGDPKSKKVYLKRPFAQLNIATEITTEEYKITLDKAEVVVDNVPSAFNVATKTSYAEERTRFVFKNAFVPQEPNKTIEVNDHTYNYVAMNYMFATNGGQTATVKYSIDATLTSRNLNGSDGTTTKATVTNAVQNVPLQENYRTNIVGNLITSTTDYEVVIDARWDDVNDPDLNGDGYLVEVWDKKYTQEPPMVDGAYQISLASELAWVAAVANGNIVATKSTTVDPTFKNITVKLIEDIDLAGALWNPIKDFDGTFDGNGKTIKNLTVKAEGMDRAALFAHAHRVKNLTVTNADIKGHYKTAVIVADAMGGGIVIEKCAVVNSTVEATPINKDEANNVGAIVGYLSAENDACVKDCVVKDVTIKAFRKVGTIAGVANCAAVVKDNVMDNVTIIADQTVEYVKNNYDGNAGPVVGWAAAEATVTGNTVGDNVVVKRYVDTTEELAYAVEDAQNGETIYIKGDVTMASFKNKSLTFVGLEGKGRVIMPKTHVNNKDFEGSSLYFENLKLYGPNYGGDTTTHGYVGAVAETYKSCTFENYYTFYSDVTNVTDCVFTGYEGQYFWTGNSNEVTFTRCQFNGVDRAVNVCANAKGESRVVTFENCNFSATVENKAALEISGDYGPYTINVKNCNVTGFKAGANTGEELFNIKNTPENVTVYVDGSEWKGDGLFEDAEGNKTVTSSNGLKTAVATEGVQVTVKDGEYTFPQTIAEGVKIICEPGTVFNGSSNLNIKTASVEGATFKNENGNIVYYGSISGTYKNCVFEGKNAFRYGYAGESIVFEDCTFRETGDGWVFHFDSASTGVTNPSIICRGCTFDGDRVAIGSAVKSLVMEDCDFINGSYFNSYCNSEYTGCNFNTSVRPLDAHHKYTDCTVKGSALAVSNLTFFKGYDCTLNIDGVAYTYADGLVKNTEGAVVAWNRGILADALAAANADMTIVLLNDIYGDVTVAQKEGVKIVIDGNDKKYDGMITVDGKSERYETAGLTIKGLTFNASSISGDACIRLGDGTDATRYTSNVTVEKCTFAVPGAAGVKSYTGGDKNLKLSGCTATEAAHSLLQAAGIDGILVQGCTINSKNGMNFNQSDNVTIDGCQAVVKGYAARFGASSGTTGVAETYAITSSNLKSTGEEGDAVIVLRATADLAILTIDSATTLEGTPQITNNADGAKIYVDGKYSVTSAADFTAALNKEIKDIVLMPGKYEGVFAIKADGTTITGQEGVVVDCINLNGKNNVTLKNITFDAAGATYGYDGVGTKKDYAFSNIITGDNVNKPNKGAHNLVIDGCKFTGAFANPGAPIAFTDHKRGGGGSGNITIKDCVFENTNANYTIYAHYAGDSTNGHGDFVIENNTFNSACYAGPIYLGRYASNIPVQVTRNTFNTVTSIDYAIYVQDHGYPNVTYNARYEASNNTFAN